LAFATVKCCGTALHYKPATCSRKQNYPAPITHKTGHIQAIFEELAIRERQQYLKHLFPKMSDAKLKEGVFVGPQVTTVNEKV
jgi:hypothetical protein